MGLLGSVVAVVFLCLPPCFCLSNLLLQYDAPASPANNVRANRRCYFEEVQRDASCDLELHVTQKWSDFT